MCETHTDKQLLEIFFPHHLHRYLLFGSWGGFPHIPWTQHKCKVGVAVPFEGGCVCPRSRPSAVPSVRHRPSPPCASVAQWNSGEELRRFLQVSAPLWTDSPACDLREEEEEDPLQPCRRVRPVCDFHPAWGTWFPVTWMRPSGRLSQVRGSGRLFGASCFWAHVRSYAAAPVWKST